MTSCICEKHKGELKSLSLAALDSKLMDESLKLYSLKQLVANQEAIVNLLHEEVECRK
jgi:hypothetical protein